MIESCIQNKIFKLIVLFLKRKISCTRAKLGCKGGTKSVVGNLSKILYKADIQIGDTKIGKGGDDSLCR
jgi:hypothetical protein